MLEFVPVAVVTSAAVGGLGRQGDDGAAVGADADGAITVEDLDLEVEPAAIDLFQFGVGDDGDAHVSGGDVADVDLEADGGLFGRQVFEDGALGVLSLPVWGAVLCSQTSTSRCPVRPGVTVGGATLDCWVMRFGGSLGWYGLGGFLSLVIITAWGEEVPAWGMWLSIGYETFDI